MEDEAGSMGAGSGAARATVAGLRARWAGVCSACCCCCFVRPPAAKLSTPPLERASRLAQKRLAAGTGL